MAYAFARDKGIPSFFDHVSPRTGVPVRTSKLAIGQHLTALDQVALTFVDAVFLMATLAFLLAVPSLGSSVAFAAATR
jgi:amino acid transporter